jgi:DNA-binding transcriptional MerR regulator/effector-binding domain-containing protein
VAGEKSFRRAKYPLTLPLREAAKSRAELEKTMDSSLFSIGDFSKITGLSVKTLRFYHEKGILVPVRVDETSGYRYYDETQVEKARVILRLRDMEFSLEDIGAIFEDCDDEAEILEYLQRQKSVLARRIQRERHALEALEEIVARESAARDLLQTAAFAVETKTLPPLLMAGVRVKGKYRDCGKGFAQLGRALGRHLAGPPFCLYYDEEYREDDADFEACFPLSQEATAQGVSVRTLAGTPCLSLLYRGPYDQLGRSYAKILKAARQQKLAISLPTREIYLKGPGMIFKGNPNKYLTEIQLPFTGKNA